MITLVQARSSSSRLPGKVLMRVGPKTILEWVLHRLALADVGKIVVATSRERSDDPVSELVRSHHIPCFRGSLDDVLDRFRRAAVFYDADAVVRVTADCPLLCPSLLTETISLFNGQRAEYASVWGAPAGLSAEIVSRNMLELAWLNAQTPYDREHVTPWIRRTLPSDRCGFVLVDEWLYQRRHWDLSVDEPRDIGVLRRLWEQHPSVFDWDTRQIVEAVEADQGLLGVVAA